MSEAHGADYWYEHRNELECDQVFKTYDGSVVRLYRRVPGDGTRWYVADWTGQQPGTDHTGWAYYDNTAEPGDLIERLSDNWPE